MRYVAYQNLDDGSIVAVQNGQTIISFRNEEWTYISTDHPRKVLVQAENGFKSEFFASVFHLGIWDTKAQMWTFTPDWPPADLTIPIKLEDLGLI